MTNSRISQALETLVQTAIKGGKSDRKADRYEEYLQLGSILANTTSVPERQYVEGFMMDYVEFAKKEEEKEIQKSMTPACKKAIEKIIKQDGDKSNISDAEAQQLAALLNNTQGNLNQADLNYIAKLLVKNGYERYLQKAPCEVNVTIVNVTGKEPPQEETQKKPESTEDNAEATTPEGENAHKNNVNPPAKSKPRAPRSWSEPSSSDAPKGSGKPSSSDAPKGSGKPISDDKGKNNKSEIKKSVISENARQWGDGLATQAAKAFKGNAFGYVTNSDVGKVCKDVNKENAYTFFGSFRKSTGKSFVTELANHHVPIKEALPAIKALLNQAGSIPQLAKTPAYAELKKEIEYLERRSKEEPRYICESDNLPQAITKLHSVMKNFVQLD